MDSEATFFARPSAERLPLETAPTDHGDHVRLTAFLDHASEVLRPRLQQLEGPLALSLELGLDDGADMLERGDLDSYLVPLVTRLRERDGRSLVSVWGSKSVADQSYVSVAPAIPLDERPVSMEFEVATTASSETTTYQRQIRDQLARALTLPDGPVALELAFEVGPDREWSALWGPTIDSLDPLLGPAVPGRAWHPRDGRIVELGLHCRVDARLGQEVRITIVPRSLAGTVS